MHGGQPSLILAHCSPLRSVAIASMVVRRSAWRATNRSDFPNSSLAANQQEILVSYRQGRDTVFPLVDDDRPRWLIPRHASLPSRSATMASMDVRSSACRATIRAISAFSSVMSMTSRVSSASTYDDTAML